jgi:DNA-binding MarR family transcriptional regulator
MKKKEAPSAQAQDLSRKPLSQEDYEMLAALRYALRRFMRFSERSAQRAGITPQQHQALLAIKGFPGGDYMTVSELAEWLQLRHHSTGELVNRLEAQGLVERTHATDDRRQVHLSLTLHGEEMLAGLSAAHRAELRQIGPELNHLLTQLNRDELHREGLNPEELNGKELNHEESDGKELNSKELNSRELN